MKSIVSTSLVRFSRNNQVYCISQITFTETSLELSPPVHEAEVVQSMKAEVLTVKRRASELKLQHLYEFVLIYLRRRRKH